MEKKPILLAGGGFVAGLIAVVSFDAAVSYTSTDEFCLSCHSHAIPYEEYKQTLHYRNVTGISPGCADCHVPHELVPMLVRKVQASREVLYHLTGKIDTDEKYLQHRLEMKSIELARLRANDSRECRSCHDEERWDPDAQTRRARKAHSDEGSAKTCIDCHEGVVHMPSG